MTKTAIKIAAAMILLFATGLRSAQAEETDLVFAIAAAPSDHIVQRMLQPWVDRVNAQGKGVLKIELRAGTTLVNDTNYYSRLVDGVVQMAYGSLAYNAGKFVKTLVVQLPYMTDNGEKGSAAFWRLYKTGMLDSEFDEIVPLYLCVFPQSRVHFPKTPTMFSLDAPNLKGIKTGVISKVLAQVAQQLDGTPISLPLGNVYEALQRGMVQVYLGPWTTFQPFKLAEVTDYHIQSSLGSGTGSVLMTRKLYNALPADARAILDANSGEATSRELGKFWDTVDKEGREATEAKGQKVVDLTPEQAANWRKLTAPIVDQWIKATPDGSDVVGKFRALVADVEAGK